jgi:protein arginine kinase
MNLGDLSSQAGEWLRGQGPMSDVVISSRIRLARNLAGFPFLLRASEPQRGEVTELVKGAIEHTAAGKRLLYLRVDDISDLDRQVLVERHLISRQLAEGEGSRGLALSREETEAVMVNEEDHLRVQVLRSGLQLEECWQRISELDDQLGRELEFAFDPRLGYLTACPTNLGTGMRVSVMLHLPALRITEELPKVFRAAKELHLAVRGLFGEGTEATGDFFQVSNQTTLGRTEDELIGQFASEIIPQIVDYEHRAREALADQRSMALDDKVNRALGVLQSARVMTSEEALFLLSHVRLGVNMKRIRNVPIQTVNELFLLTQPAHLQKLQGRALDDESRRIARANYIRSRLSQN